MVAGRALRRRRRTKKPRGYFYRVFNAYDRQGIVAELGRDLDTEEEATRTRCASLGIEMGAIRRLDGGRNTVRPIPKVHVKPLPKGSNGTPAGRTNQIGGRGGKPLRESCDDLAAGGVTVYRQRQLASAAQMDAFSDRAFRHATLTARARSAGSRSRERSGSAPVRVRGSRRGSPSTATRAGPDGESDPEPPSSGRRHDHLLELHLRPASPGVSAFPNAPSRRHGPPPREPVVAAYPIPEWTRWHEFEEGDAMHGVDAQTNDFRGRTSRPATPGRVTDRTCRGCGSQLVGRLREVRRKTQRTVWVYQCPCGAARHFRRGVTA
jgi:hypothetical protein